VLPVSRTSAAGTSTAPTSVDVAAPVAPSDADAPPRRRDWPVAEALAALVVVSALLRPRLAHWFDAPAFRNWATVFLAVAVQALPFLALGVFISGALAVVLTPGVLARVVPRRPVLAVATAGIAGAALPGCECSSVPIAAQLVRRGAPEASALTFLLSAPAINPVVLVATAVAFPGRPEMVAARFLGSLATAIVVGLVWQRMGWPAIPRHVHQHAPGTDARTVFADTALHDFLHAGGYLVVGAAASALLQTVVPRSILDTVSGHAVIAVGAMALLAVLLAVCSEADAFVASGLSQFSLTARLAFLVVGPAVDVKLVAMQAGTFGRSFAARFAPLTFITAVVMAVLVGWLLL
jgi:uncharacterized membrane protein YraQ (UPF0718 family)